MTFTRQPTDKWRNEVPGARWFKADLQIHTIDDHAGGNAKLPPGLSGDPADAATQARYARLFLQAAARRGVQVLGLTPHSPRAGAGPDTSAVWRIVEEWNTGIDDDGAPFRDKIYAVFPGFEPSCRDGSRGLHLLFLFDPEIGRDRYLRLFDTVMGGIDPWRDGALQISSRRAEDVFGDIHTFRNRDGSNANTNDTDWSYLVLAPHADSSKGLLDALKAQVLQLFDHDEIAALELGDNKLPADALKNRPWLRDGMAQHRQAFFHASDAYGIDDIGMRYTWIKLATPRIEALRQAFLARDSRVRIGFRKTDAGALCPIETLPDPVSGKIPWLKEVSVTGRASFFGGAANPQDTGTIFRLNPDLTCIIGGSMTGKSTFLDGLRIHIGAPLPSDDLVRKQVESRGRNRFLGGSPAIALTCPGQDQTAPSHEQWPALFFAQNELQQLSQDAAAIEDILARLVPSETAGIEVRTADLRDLDAELALLVSQLKKMDDTLADAEQAYERTVNAKRTLDTFSEAGVARLHRASRRRQLWKSAADSARSELGPAVRHAADAAHDAKLPSHEGNDSVDGTDDEVAPSEAGLNEQRDRIVAGLDAMTSAVNAWIADVTTAADAAARRESAIRAEVERALAEHGYDAGKLQELQALNRSAALLPQYESLVKDTRADLAKAEDRFNRALADRRDIVKEQRLAFDRVTDSVRRDFKGRIAVRRDEEAEAAPLEGFLKELTQRGVTRWWNDIETNARPSPSALLERLRSETLHEVGMSGAVQATFRESMTKSKQRELAALRCPDRYSLELRMDDGGYRALDRLSGGQRVSVLLSLLFETNDSRPLVIDQPEDELDNRFLWDTVLPALKKLRGRRQVIVATHNANIVVNADPDMVIQLDATAHRGRIAAEGAIEDPVIRDAIVRTVDGGERAFRLRRQKYGF